ncbi:MAG: MarR family winged helix-turn-helix transcriptional regulator [Hyphomicrobiaceae bacterium]
MSQEPEFAELLLDSQLCFALYAASRAVTKSFRDFLGPMGITYPQYLVLVVLWENDGSTISEVGRRLHLDSGTLTPLMKRLESDGIVERRRGTRDEREVEVWLTQSGIDLKPKAAHAQASVVSRLRMTNEELADLRSQVMLLMDRLNNVTEDSLNEEKTDRSVNSASCQNR